jgi:flagellar motor switch protein FliM
MFATPLLGTKDLPFADILLSMTAVVTAELYKVDEDSGLGFMDVQFDQYDLRERRVVVSELTLPIQTARGKFKNLLPFLTVEKLVELHVKLQLETPEDRGA